MRRPLIAAAAALALLVAACTDDDTASTTSDPAETTTTTAAGTDARGSAGCRDDARPPEVGPQEVAIDGTTRRYVLSLPPSSDEPAPLIVLLHGLGMDADSINDASDLPDLAAAQGTIVVTPEALGSPALWQSAPDGPDAALLDQILADVQAAVCVDLDRVAVAGFSAGAAFAAQFACGRQDEIAALAVVAVEFPGGCTQPMPIVAFHGTADPVVPITGTEPNMAEWAAIGACDPEPERTDRGGRVDQIVWMGCDDPAEVVLYTIDGGGHAWPDEPEASTSDILAFFADHPRPQ